MTFVYFIFFNHITPPQICAPHGLLSQSMMNKRHCTGRTSRLHNTWLRRSTAVVEECTHLVRWWQTHVVYTHLIDRWLNTGRRLHALTFARMKIIYGWLTLCWFNWRLEQTLYDGLTSRLLAQFNRLNKHKTPQSFNKTQKNHWQNETPKTLSTRFPKNSSALFTKLPSAFQATGSTHVQLPRRLILHSSPSSSSISCSEWQRPHCWPKASFTS